MAFQEKFKDIPKRTQKIINDIEEIYSMSNIIEFEPNYALTHFIEKLFVKRNKNILRLKIIELTATKNKSAVEIAKILKSGNRYIEQEKSKIRDIIKDNEDIFQIYGEKPTEVIKKFYEEYKIHFWLIYNKFRVKKINQAEYIDELYKLHINKGKAIYPYKI